MSDKEARNLAATTLERLAEMTDSQREDFMDRICSRKNGYCPLCGGPQPCFCDSRYDE